MSYANSHAAAISPRHTAARPLTLAFDAVWIEKAIAVAGFLILMSTFRQLLLSGAQESARTEGSLLFQLVSGSIFISGLVVMLIRKVPAWALTVLLKSWPLVLIALFPLLSTLWVQAPDATLRRSVT